MGGKFRLIRRGALFGAGVLMAGMVAVPAAQARPRVVAHPRAVNVAEPHRSYRRAAGRTIAASPQLLTVGSCNGSSPYTTIQSALDASSDGDTVVVCPGTYTENLTVSTSVTLSGTGQDSTLVEPGISDPNCGGSGGGSLCPGGSNVILVQADNVTIQDLTIDGDNPSLQSNVVVNGADIDARNGIITNHSAGVFNNLNVHEVTIRNTYLRGIYASSGGTFSFDNNTVTNVAANPSSVAMFNFGGSGDMTGNTVSLANDAISANHSSGTIFLNNDISQSGSGVHTDNAGDGGGTADVISGNTVTSCMTDGYGVWDFVPYIAPTVDNNSVSGCGVGLGSFGSGAAVTTAFTKNRVDGTAATVSSGTPIGVYVSTTEFGFGDSDVNATFQDSTITNVAGNSVYVEQTGGMTPAVGMSFNRMSGNSAGLANASNQTVSAADNWWGCNGGPNTIGCDAVTGSGSTTFSPWLVMNITAVPGHTYDTSVITGDLTHDDLGADTSGSGHLPDGTLVGFSTTAGSLDHSSAPITNGQATALLSANGDHGQAVVTTSLDNGSASTNVVLIRPSLTINNVSMTDGSSGTKQMMFTVRLNRAADTTVTVNYQTVDGTATSSGTGFGNPDYDAASGMLTFLPGDTSKAIPVTIRGYPYREDMETFSVVLSSPSPNALILPGAGVGKGHILNDDPLPKVSVSKAVSAVAGQSAVFSVSLSGPSDQVVTVHYTTANGTANAPSDYTASSGTVTLSPGDTSVQVAVATIADAHPDPAESFTFKISAPTNATLGSVVKGTATIKAH